MELTHFSLFSGIGGIDLAASWAGFHTVGFCEKDEYCQKVLHKHWPDVPIWSDIHDVTAESVRAAGIQSVNLISGGFPCQDISQSGHQIGITGKRSGLWTEMRRVISELRPQFALMENVSNLLAGGGGEWFGRVLGDLAEIGYDAEWHCIPASYVGSCHHRDRIFIIAYPIGKYVSSMDFSKSFCVNSEESRRRKYTRAVNAAIPADDYTRMRRNHDGGNSIMDRLKALGNAVVPQQVYPILAGIAHIIRVSESTA